ncbi:MauE/DoxX family redox-associated membrane protein [Kitasatospora sp. NPDC002227]|uniref:MauE/DoxX family redox-associated membrane protein n=1 Tax=Kitasatospora sp. NPDC002227 TaxID=3154773 RepID=UPI003326269F
MAETAMVALRAAVLLVMAAAVAGKVRQRGGLAHFTDWVGTLGLVPKSWSAVVARATVCAEAATAVLVVLPWTVPVALALAGLVFGIFAVATWRLVRRRSRTRCYCFGPSTAQLGPRHVVRDGALAIAAVLGLAGTGLPLPPTAGILLGVPAGALAALLVVRLDDLADLFTV